MGGGWRQAGYLAAAGLYALENNVDRLADDHRRAARLAEALRPQPYVAEVLAPETNLVIFRLRRERMPAADFLAAAGGAGHPGQQLRPAVGSLRDAPRRGRCHAGTRIEAVHLLGTLVRLASPPRQSLLLRVAAGCVSASYLHLITY